MLFKYPFITFYLPKKNRFALSLFTLFFMLTPPISNATLITFINEIHYDNSSSDVNEFIEIASLASSDLSNLALVLYNGGSGKQYQSKTLSSYTLSNINNGYGFIKIAISGIQNGTADGIALVNNETSKVLQFLSYEGTLTAIDGLASGMTSVDINVKESSSTPIGFSLQLGGNGRYYKDFYWQKAQVSSPNTVNINQRFTQVPEPNTKYLLLLGLTLLIFRLTKQCKAQLKLSKSLLSLV